MDPQDVFPARLRALREAQKPTPKMKLVSELMGLSKDALRRYERGEREALGSSLVKIADYYGVSVDFLLGRTDQPQMVEEHLQAQEKN